MLLKVELVIKIIHNLIIFFLLNFLDYSYSLLSSSTRTILEHLIKSILKFYFANANQSIEFCLLRRLVGCCFFCSYFSMKKKLLIRLILWLIIYKYYLLSSFKLELLIELSYSYAWIARNRWYHIRYHILW